MGYARALALRLCALISVINALLLLMMTVVMFSLVITRYFFSYSPPWSEEVTNYSMVWMGMLGGAVLTLFDDHISLSFLSSLLGPRGKRIHAIVMRLLVIGVSLVLVYTAWKFTMSMVGIRAPGSRLPMWLPVSSILVSAVLSVLFQWLRLFQDLFLGSAVTSEMDERQADFMDSSFKLAEE